MSAGLVWGELQGRFNAEMDDFVGVYGTALKGFEALNAIRGEAQGSGFAAEAAGLLAVPNILNRELLAALEAEIRRHRSAAAPQPKPAPGWSRRRRRPRLPLPSRSRPRPR